MCPDPNPSGPESVLNIYIIWWANWKRLANKPGRPTSLFIISSMRISIYIIG